MLDVSKKRPQVNTVAVGYRIPPELHGLILRYAVRHSLTASEAVRRLLEGALKTSQRR